MNSPLARGRLMRCAPCSVEYSTRSNAANGCFAPSSAAFVASGRVLAAIAAREGWQSLDEKPSLLNDALIAASCRERGITLITRDGDFKRLAPFVKGFRYAAPWPPADEAR